MGYNCNKDCSDNCTIAIANSKNENMYIFQYVLTHCNI